MSDETTDFPCANTPLTWHWIALLYSRFCCKARAVYERCMDNLWSVLDHQSRLATVVGLERS